MVASVFFSSDTANPDTYPHFYCDAQMYNTTMTQPDPQFFMNQYCRGRWRPRRTSGRGATSRRWQSKEYDDIYKQAEQELDAVKRAAMYIKLNDMVVGDNYIQPVLPPAEGRGRRQGRCDRASQRLGQRSVAARELVPGNVRPASEICDA